MAWREQRHMTLPPTASRTSQEVGGEVDLLGHWDMQRAELALQSAKPVISVQGLLSISKGGWLRAQELSESVAAIPQCILLHQLLKQALIAPTVLLNGHQDLSHRGWWRQIILIIVVVTAASAASSSHSGDLTMTQLVSTSEKWLR
jgi:hypothetical protein